MQTYSGMKDTLVEAFGEAGSIVIALVSMLILFSAIAIIPNIALLGQVFTSTVPISQKLSFILALFQSPAANATTVGFIAILTNVFLSGIVIALSVYAFRKRAKNVGAMGVSGIGMVSAFIGIGCASCGSLLLTTLIPFLGIGALASILPLGGVEFSILGIVLLLAAAYQLLKQIAKPMTCNTLAA